MINKDDIGRSTGFCQDEDYYRAALLHEPDDEPRAFAGTGRRRLSLGEWLPKVARRASHRRGHNM